MERTHNAEAVASFVLLTLLCALGFDHNMTGPSTELETQKEESAVDNDWFMLQRVYPFDDVDPRKYEAARATFAAMASLSPSMSTPWQSVGPSNIGGRITSLALHPTNESIIYAGAAAGGLWKSTDGGGTWNPVFNESPSIGSLILDPVDPNTIYVGTGEANPGGVAIYPGNGVWRSIDAGTTWSHLGLINTGHIGKLAIHQSAPNRVFAAALGRYRSRTNERGIYRSTDAGATWQQVLFINDTTGACDVLIDPADPAHIYAALWNRYRPITYSIISGIQSGLFVSTDAGDSWNQVTNGFPGNDPTLGRTSLAVSPSSPNIVYALTTQSASIRGVYKTTDSGISWTQVASAGAFGSEGQVWYNNILAVQPTNPDVVLAGMTNMYRSTNGGISWSNVTGSMHVDHHAILFSSSSPSRVAVGNDGGVFLSTNTGTSWTKSLNLPVSQFYAGTIDFSNPQRYYGGMQDNGTARTLTGSVNDWSGIYGGDGFYVLVDPTNPNRIYAESQNGGLGYSTNGGGSFQNGRTGISSSDRKNWNTPIAMDLSNTLTLYTGTHRVYQTTNGMASWAAISGDLTRGQNGRIGTITTIDVARTDPNVVYVGTDDGKVSVTTNGGNNWIDVTGPLPQRWVTRVSIDPDSANVVYVTHSGYLEDSFPAHIHRSDDYGQTWINIGSTLPDIPLNDVLIDPITRPNLYVATDAGVIYSTDLGNTWNILGTDHPFVPVHDLTLHGPSRTLLASTHGRSAYIIDLTGVTSIASSQWLPAEFVLNQNYPNPFNPKTTISFALSKATDISLVIYDAVGSQVEELLKGSLRSGAHEVSWDASGLSSGIYFYKLETDGERQVRKMVLLK